MVYPYSRIRTINRGSYGGAPLALVYEAWIRDKSRCSSTSSAMNRARCSDGSQSSSDGGNNRSCSGANARNVLLTGTAAAGSAGAEPRPVDSSNNSNNTRASSSGTPDSPPSAHFSSGARLACY